MWLQQQQPQHPLQQLQEAAAAAAAAAARLPLQISSLYQRPSDLLRTNSILTEGPGLSAAGGPFTSRPPVFSALEACELGCTHTLAARHQQQSLATAVVVLLVTAAITATGAAAATAAAEAIECLQAAALVGYLLVSLQPRPSSPGTAWCCSRCSGTCVRSSSNYLQQQPQQQQPQQQQLRLQQQLL
ncbi:hypothetical protein ACSSS7_007114 [Eimeria intestinalis]